jgi:hypothetical protein
MTAANTQDTGARANPAGGILRLLLKKITVTLDQKMLAGRQKRTRLTRELAKLDPAEEKRIAEEGFGNLSHDTAANEDE